MVVDDHLSGHEEVLGQLMRFIINWRPVLDISRRAFKWLPVGTKTVQEMLHLLEGCECNVEGREFESRR